MKLGLDFGNVIHVHSVHTGSGFYPGVMEALHTLKDQFGSEMYIISRVNTDAGAEKTKVFLEKNGVYDLIAPENVHFCYKREEKAPIAEKLGITHFVDDRLEVLAHMTTVPFKYALAPDVEQRMNWEPDENTKVLSDWPQVVEHIFLSIAV